MLLFYDDPHVWEDLLSSLHLSKAGHVHEAGFSALGSVMSLCPGQAHFTIAPDWIAEVASSSTTQKDRVLKVPIYDVQHAVCTRSSSANGCGHALAWLRLDRFSGLPTSDDLPHAQRVYD